MKIRVATQDDSPGIIALIDRVYQEYGDAVNLEGAEADLMDLQTNYFAKAGCFWVLEDQSQIVGSHAALVSATNPQVCNFRRLYLDAALRGSPWSQALMQLTIDWAREQGCKRVEFWSDTRFARAHRFFDKFGFQKTGEIRQMHDGHIPYSEYFYFLALDHQ